MGRKIILFLLLRFLPNQFGFGCFVVEHPLPLGGRICALGYIPVLLFAQAILDVRSDFIPVMLSLPVKSHTLLFFLIVPIYLPVLFLIELSQSLVG